MSTPPPDISRLTYADLPQVIAIERRAFPAPWSLAMFVLELSKAGGVVDTPAPSAGIVEVSADPGAGANSTAAATSATTTRR